MPIKREIYTYSAAEQLIQLLQGVILAELLFPSKRLWLYPPWISNIPLLDNRANSFRHIEPLWSRNMVGLNSVLTKLVEMGSEVFVMSNASQHNDEFFYWINQMNAKGYDNLKGLRRKELHQKGLLCDQFYIKGSMNFTYNGLTTLDERVEFTNDMEDVAKAKLEFEFYWNENAKLL